MVPLDRCSAHNMQKYAEHVLIIIIPELVYSCVVIIIVSAQKQGLSECRMFVCIPPLYRCMHVDAHFFESTTLACIRQLQDSERVTASMLAAKSGFVEGLRMIMACGGEPSRSS